MTCKSENEEFAGYLREGVYTVEETVEDGGIGAVKKFEFKKKEPPTRAIILLHRENELILVLEK